jgi:hypothetical protein
MLLRYFLSGFKVVPFALITGITFAFTLLLLLLLLMIYSEQKLEIAIVYSVQ